jgi:diguanylate cyclase (GGDEF)-like protein
VLAALRSQEPAPDPELVGELAERLASVFGDLSGAAAEALIAAAPSAIDPLTGLLGAEPARARLAQLTAQQKRYGQPFALVVLAVEGPGLAADDRQSHESTLAVVAAALRQSIRIADEAFRLENDELGVLAPNQTAEDAERMAERVSTTLSHREEVGGLPITISAGVVACPDHGDEPARLLRAADTAMWRARATGRPVQVASLQDS